MGIAANHRWSRHATLHTAFVPALALLDVSILTPGLVVKSFAIAR